MHWKSLSRPKFEMVNGGGLLQVPTAFSGRYVEFVQSSAFGHNRLAVTGGFRVTLAEQIGSRPQAAWSLHSSGHSQRLSRCFVVDHNFDMHQDFREIAHSGVS